MHQPLDPPIPPDLDPASSAPPPPPRRRRLLGLVAAAALLYALVGIWLGGRALLGDAALPLPAPPTLSPVPARQPSALLSPPEGATPAPLPGRTTILLLGIDQRPDQRVSGGDPGRSDTLVLVTIDPGRPRAAILSLPRDLLVPIPGHGRERINAAYTFGEYADGDGPRLAARTVGELLGIPVDHYAAIDMAGLRKLIDAVGGVKVEVPVPLRDNAFPTDDYGVTTIEIPAGRQVLNGERALWYARTRHQDNDFNRERRQQQVLLALRERILQAEVLPRLPALLPDLLATVRTDLGPAEILQLASLARQFDAEHTERLAIDEVLAPHVSGPNGAYYLALRPGAAAVLRAFLAGEPAPPLPELPPVAVENGTDLPGLAGRTSSYLRQLGYPVAAVGDSATTPPRSQVLAPPDLREAAVALAASLDLPGEAVVELEGEEGTELLRLVLGADFRLPTG